MPTDTQDAAPRAHPGVGLRYQVDLLGHVLFSLLRYLCDGLEKLGLLGGCNAGPWGFEPLALWQNSRQEHYCGCQREYGRYEATNAEKEYQRKCAYEKTDDKGYG